MHVSMYFSYIFFPVEYSLYCLDYVRHYSHALASDQTNNLPVPEPQLSVEGIQFVSDNPQLIIDTFRSYYAF